MAICEMKKLALITHLSDIEKVTNELIWLGAVEISSYDEKLADPEWKLDVAKIDADAELAETDGKLHSLSSAISLCGAYAKPKKGLFSLKKYLSRDDIDNPGLWYGKAFETANSANEIIKAMNNLKNTQNRLEAQKISLLPWVNLDVPLSLNGTENSALALAATPAICNIDVLSDKLNSTGGIETEHVSSDEYMHYFAFLYHKRDEETANALLTENGFSRIGFADVDVTAAKKINEIDSEIKKINDKIEELKNDAAKLSEEMGNLEKCYDVTLAKRLDIQTRQKFMKTGDAAFIEGYIPAQKVDKLEKIVLKYNCCAEVSDPDLENADEIAKTPVLLENNKFADPFEFVVGLYSYPAYKTFDPTMIMSIFYFMIFGLMLGDFVYGLLLTVVGFAAVKLMRPQKGMKKLLLMFGICGISTMVVGILFGSYLGNLPASIAEYWFGKDPSSVKTYILFDPLSQPMWFLGISVGLGALHLFTGMGIKMYILIKQGKVFDAIADIGMWYLIFIGLILFVALGTPGIVVSLIGVLGLICTQGRNEKNIIMKFLKGVMSLYGVTGYLSDLMSYARILALSLAGAVISMVVNLLGTMAGGGDLISKFTSGDIVGILITFIALIIAVVLGHSLNIALSILGAFVHAARLQYIEFFGKFYEDGGRPFAPVSIEPKYTGINYEEVNE